MNRTIIYRKIIQSIKDYITDPTNFKAHRAKGYLIRKRKLKNIVPSVNSESASSF